MFITSTALYEHLLMNATFSYCCRAFFQSTNGETSEGDQKGYILCCFICVFVNNIIGSSQKKKTAIMDGSDSDSRDSWLLCCLRVCKDFLFHESLLWIQNSYTNTGLILDKWCYWVCMSQNRKSLMDKTLGPNQMWHQMPHVLLVFVLLLCWAVSCARKQSRMAVFIQKSSNVKGNRCQGGKRIQGQETLLVSIASSDQRAFKILKGITAKLRFKDGFEEDCAYYLLLSTPSIITSCIT